MTTSIERSSTAAEIVQKEAQRLLQVYRRGNIVFERGSGTRLFSQDGKSYIDLISGVGVASLGHAHPKLADAIAQQAKELLHTSNLFFHPLQSEVASRLTALTGLDRTFFCNSGTEAVEACLKFARRYWHALGTPRSKFVAFEHAFHGRTIGSLSVTWDDHYRAPFQPLLDDVTFVATNEPAALKAAVSSDTAAVIVEPIQGEGGVRPLPRATAAAIDESCRASGALLIADEVQCGLGRTGRAICSPAFGLQPDLMALGKSLGAGVPVAAAMFSEKVATKAAFGDHGSTYGGNLLACRAALVFLTELVDGGLMDHVAKLGRHAEGRLQALAARHTAIKDVRGAGLMWGIDLDRPAAEVVQAALERGLLINRTSDTVIRLLPPYIISTDEFDAGIGILEQAITAVTEGVKQ
jgi:acetylornithine aminotransferase/acetylornithine/N-succinyldiaminopimelate aminotransferase